ncbi:MAG: phosphatidylglycerol lysyltransferase domain-containing protein [Firmicutes bacterium]|nr:phosphatidylglycerol lysyltransferase domain-containing protein [Bacillota bacterium]
MLSFKKAEITDRDAICDILKKSPCYSMEYNFTLLFMWQNQYGMEFAIDEDMLFIRAGRGEKTYLFPCGTGDLKSALEKLFDFCPDGISFYSLNSEQKEFLEKEYPKRFSFKENRNAGDYVYLSESLANLKGKKLSSKRNHINRFEAQHPDWSYEVITAHNISEVIKMHARWCEMQDMEERKGLKEETEAVKLVLENFEALKLSGGLIRTEGEVVAFSVGDILNKDTFLVHIEKAFSNINGAYPIINREFVRHNCLGFRYVNREDDASDEGLRAAKLSYQPYEIIRKFNAKEIK